MNAETFCEQFATFAEAPNGVAKLRELILQLAVQGKLVPQDVNDEPAGVLIGRIEKRKSELIRQALIPKPSAFPAVSEDNLPFSIPTGWQWIRLESVCEIITKGSSPTWQGVQYVDANDGVLFVTSENVGNYVLRKMDEPKYVERKFNEMEPRSILQRDDLLVNLVGASIGRSAIYDRDDVANINQAVGIIRLVRGDIALDRWYLLHYLNSPVSLRIMFEEQVETARANLSLTNMKHFLVPLPPLAEQRRIVGKVDQLLGLCDELAARQAARREARSALVGATLDRLVSARSAAEFPAHAHRLRDHFDRLFDTPTTLPQLRQAILQLAVQGQLVPQDPNDEPVETLLITAERKKAKWEGPIDEQEVPFQLPPSWKWFRLGDISMLKHGYAFSSQFFTSEPAPFVLTTPGNFYEKGGFRDRESKRKYYSGPVDPEFILKPGDLIIPMTEQAAGLLGSPAFIPDDGRVYVHNQRLGKLSFSELIAPEFAFWFFNSEFFRGELARTCTGMKVRHTSPDRVLRVPFPVPPLSEQKRIVSKVTELLSLCDALEAKLTQAESASTQLLSAAVHHLLSDSTANGKAASCPM